MFNVGDKMQFPTWRKLMNKALELSSEGYGVEVIGFNDMSENILTITAVPEGETCETK